MEEKEKIKIENIDGTIEIVDLITYLISEDNLRNYLVYSKGEKQGAESDNIIYISKIISENDELKLEEIVNDAEWVDVQHLLKKIANS